MPKPKRWIFSTTLMLDFSAKEHHALTAPPSRRIGRTQTVYNTRRVRKIVKALATRSGARVSNWNHRADANATAVILFRRWELG